MIINNKALLFFAKHKVMTTLMLVFIGLLITPNIIVRILPSRAKLSLPQSASCIHEKYIGCVHYDYIRFLKAKIPKDDFINFINEYGMLTKFDLQAHSYVSEKMRINFKRVAPYWWDADCNDISNCYFIYRSEDDYFVCVKYQNGWLYYCEAKT